MQYFSWYTGGKQIQTKIVLNIYANVQNMKDICKNNNILTKTVSFITQTLKADTHFH